MQVSQHVHRELAERLEEQNNQVAMLEDENARLRAALAAAADSAPKLDSHESSAAESELVTLREQFANHAKERTALKTILESKIHALVGDIQQSVHSLGGEAGQPGSRILRQVGALDKLVGATVNAMRAVTPA
jgi:glutamyl-tRNA reductase